MKKFIIVVSVMVITFVLCFLITHSATTAVIAQELKSNFGDVSEEQYNYLWNQYVLSNGGYLTILFKKSAASAYVALGVLVLGCLLAVGFSTGKLPKLKPSIKHSGEGLVASTPDDKIQLITKLGMLKDSGAITQEEFEEKKLKILS